MVFNRGTLCPLATGVQKKPGLDRVKHGLLERGINISLSIQLHDPCTIGKLSIRLVKICNFTGIERKTEE